MKTLVMKQAKASFEKLMRDMISLVYLSHFLLRARQHAKDFTRRRKLPFANLMFFLLHQQRCSTQCALERYFRAKGDMETTMTQQSLSDARQKIKWQAFQEIQEQTVSGIYREECCWNT
ncbi:MAG: hypothetical protein RR547_10225 [Raoultibacter sp.]